MPKSIKVIRLYKTLSPRERSGFDIWLKEKKDYKQNNALFGLIIAIKDYLVDCNKEKGNLTWENWLKNKALNKPKDFNNRATELNDEIENYLLEQSKKTDLTIQKEIELFHIYRERGIPNEQKHINKRIAELLNDCDDFYLHYLCEQLRHEVIIMDSKFPSPEDKKLLRTTFYLHWTTEYLFHACEQKEEDPFITAFLAKNSSLQKENKMIAFYLSLYEFILEKNLDAQKIDNFYERLTPLMLEFNKSRRTDVYVLFYKKILRWYNENRTYLRVDILLKYTKIGFDPDKKWFYHGQYAPYVLYSNWVGLCFMYYEFNRKEMRNVLIDIQQNYKKGIHPSENIKDEELLQMKIDYYIHNVKKYENICSVNTAVYSSAIEKGQLILLQLKIGLFLAQQKGAKYHTEDFWKSCINKLNIYAVPNDSNQTLRMKQVNEECYLWKMMHLRVCSRSLKIRRLTKLYLQKWLYKQKLHDAVFVDKLWYFRQIPPLIYRQSKRIPLKLPAIKP